MSNLVSTNPGKNYQKIGQVKISTSAEIKKKVFEAHKAKLLWKELCIKKRIELIKEVYQLFLQKKAEITNLTIAEIGKPQAQAQADWTWDTGYFKEYLQNAASALQDETTYQQGQEVNKIVYEPFGVAAVIVPWNYPFSNFVWGTIPNLLVGNTVVFKHSEECPLIGKVIDEVMTKSHLPKGVFSQVYGDGKVGEALARENIDLIWFIGSSKVGKHLYEIAGQKFIKAIMELGGSNPCLVFEDVKAADIIENIYTARFNNCGQVCDALKRLIVHESKFDEVVKLLKQRIEKAQFGDPTDVKTEIGPLVAKRQLELLDAQVQDAVKKGAKIITGGKISQEFKGAYFEPTLLVNIKPDMRVWHEEVFGPVLPVVKFKTEAEAINLANDTVYGLGAKIYCQDQKKALKIAAKIDAGCIDVNQGDHWKFCNPFGGYKSSGMGREHGSLGFKELCQVKVVAYK
ncbi:aldehyde dehydrogenase [Candidatus Beckwithbacteria bacterium]|nr:aldehyde dehydrogenase [Candidatus Beckwithbacteria bacterium]